MVVESCNRPTNTTLPRPVPHPKPQLYLDNALRCCNAHASFGAPSSDLGLKYDYIDAAASPVRHHL